MTNHQQQVEALRKEFEELYFSSRSELHINRRCLFRQSMDRVYTSIGVENNWQGFLLAKRNQPVIELPANYYSPDNFDIHGSAVEAFDSAIDDCKLAITASGYSYRVKP